LNRRLTVVGFPGPVPSRDLLEQRLASRPTREQLIDRGVLKGMGPFLHAWTRLSLFTRFRHCIVQILVLRHVFFSNRPSFGSNSLKQNSGGIWALARAVRNCLHAIFLSVCARVFISLRCFVAALFLTTMNAVDDDTELSSATNRKEAQSAITRLLVGRPSRDVLTQRHILPDAS
jgi:hypothetical protein